MARRGKFGTAALLTGAAAVAAGVVLKREKVTGLLSRGSRDASEPSWTPAPAPPEPSNYDAPGPVANTATPVPAPEPFVRGESGSIDEAAEEAAAAAEAANIGGQVSDYAAVRDPDLVAAEADRPLVEAGEGSSEGQEQAEAALADAAAQPAEGGSDYERQIEDAIEDAGRPFAGEQVEPVAPLDEPAVDAEQRAAEQAAAADMAGPATPAAQTPAVPATDPEPPVEATAPPEGEQVTPAAPQTAGWQPPAGNAPASSDPTPPSEEQSPGAGEDENDDGGDDWRTWSGRAVNP